VRVQEIRPHERRRSQRQGRLDGPIARGDAGAHAAERGQDLAGRPEGRPGELRGGGGSRRSAADAAAVKADAIDKASRRLVYEVVLSEDEGNFKFNKTELPDAAKQKIDEMVAQLKQDPKNVFIEIEGHTDNVGPKLVNQKVGLERAEAVQRYLYEQYQVPLHKMNVISYGEDKPIAPNKTKAGRAQNRRVVIKVLA
jgi:outer membrane protein OmpA-like peptidoglycan-associated protein